MSPRNWPASRDLGRLQRIGLRLLSGIFFFAPSIFFIFTNLKVSLFSDASLHLYKRVRPSVCWSVHRSVGHAYVKTRKIIIFKQVIRGGSILHKCHIIISSYNHFIIMRTRHLPYWPCILLKNGVQNESLSLCHCFLLYTLYEYKLYLQVSILTTFS